MKSQTMRESMESSMFSVDGAFRDTLNFKKLERFKEHTIDAVIAKVEKGTSELTLRALVGNSLEDGQGDAACPDGGQIHSGAEYVHELPFLRHVV